MRRPSQTAHIVVAALCLCLTGFLGQGQETRLVEVDGHQTHVRVAGLETAAPGRPVAIDVSPAWCRPDATVGRGPARGVERD